MREKRFRENPRVVGREMQIEGANPQRKERECVTEIKLLNKMVRYTASGIELEADPRHAEIFIRDLGLTEGNPSKVPGATEH